MQLRSGCRNQNPSCPSLYNFWGSGAGGAKSVIIHQAQRAASDRIIHGAESPLQCKRCQHFDHMQRHFRYTPWWVTCVGFHLSAGCPAPWREPQHFSCGGDHTVNYWGCVKWQVAKVTLAWQAPKCGQQGTAPGHPAALKAKTAGHSAEQRVLGGTKSSEWACCQGQLSNPQSESLASHGGSQAAKSDKHQEDVQA